MIRSPPRVNRLRIVAHHHQIAMVCAEEINELGLQGIRVLILIHEYKLELLLIFLRNRRVIGKQVVKVGCVCVQLAPRIQL